MEEQTFGSKHFNAIMGRRIEVAMLAQIGVVGNPRDKGTLEAYEYPWLRLRRDNGEVIMLMVHGIWFVKIVE